MINRYGDRDKTSVCESMRQRSMSLDQLPKPLIDEPITYRPQSTTTQTDRQTVIDKYLHRARRSITHCVCLTRNLTLTPWD